MGQMVTRSVRELTDANIENWQKKNLDSYDVQALAETFEAFRNGTLEDKTGFCAVKTLDDIQKQEYILTPGRYVGIAEQEEDIEPFDEKMDRLTSELSELFKESQRLEDEIMKQLGRIGFPFS